jgi:hypothetical protein
MTTMKKAIAFFILFLCIYFAFAQKKKPLTGSGKIAHKSFSFTHFNEVNLIDMDGKAEISIGDSFRVAVDIDDNLESLLSVMQTGNTLSMTLKGNLNNRLYIENTNIKVKIILPKIASIKLDGNNSLQVNGIVGDYLKVKCTGNGSMFLSGTIETVKIVATDNGRVHAEKLIAKNIETTRRGNGNIFTTIDKTTRIKSDDDMHTKRVQVIIKNNTNTKQSLSVKYPDVGAYGIGINANESVTESFPVGTKIYKGNQFTLFKKALFVIEKDSEGKMLEIKE